MATPDAVQPERHVTDLRLEGIDKSFGSVPVLRDFSLSVATEELCCLLGPSGCGKTTALHIINGLLPPDRGRVLIGGEDVTRVPPQRRNLGMVFQSYALFPHLNVFENVAYGLRRRRRPAPEVASGVSEVLKMVRLEGYETRRVHELSGGQQQRVALARALVIRPRLWLLDEPLSSLDARLRSDMRDEIRRIQRELGITTVYVTHDREEALSIADRIAVMRGGVIRQYGTPRDVYERPTSRFVADFIGQVNFLPGRVSGGQLEVLGRVIPLPKGDWKDGDTVTAALRPEQLRLNSEARPGIPATVREVSYHGAAVRYLVTPKTFPGTPLTVAAAATATLRFEPGAPVSLDFDAAGIHLFPGSAE